MDLKFLKPSLRKVGTTIFVWICFAFVFFLITPVVNCYAPAKCGAGEMYGLFFSPCVCFTSLEVLLQGIGLLAIPILSYIIVSFIISKGAKK